MLGIYRNGDGGQGRNRTTDTRIQASAGFPAETFRGSYDTLVNMPFAVAVHVEQPLTLAP